MIAIDTHLLVYAHRALVAEHVAATRVITRAARSATGWGVALPCVAEFWNIVTRPAAHGPPSTPAQAASFLRALVRTADMRVWNPASGFAVRFLDLAAAMRMRSVGIFDLQIGLIAQEGGATEIWTHDHAFLAPPGLRVVDPLA